MLKKFFFTAILTISPLIAQAGLILNISEDTIGGGTIWKFSGSTIAVGTDSFSSDNFVSAGEAWSDLLFDLTNVNDFDAAVSSGAASLTIAGDTRAIESVYIDDDGVTGDEFGVDVAGGVFTFNDGDLISWTGTITVDTIDINDFLVSSFSLLDFVPGGGSQVMLDVNIGSSVDVPEPSTLAVLSLSLFGLVAARRKRKYA
jgi:hypothetical protein